MNLFLTLNERIYLLLNQLSGRSQLFDALVALAADNNLVKAGPVCAAFFFAWFSGTTFEDKRKRRGILLATLGAAAIVVAATKSLGGSIFVPRPIIQSVPMYAIQSDRLVEASPLAIRVPLAGEAPRRVESLRRGEISRNDMVSFPSDHAGIFFALSLGVAAACRRAGLFALGWTLIVTLLSRVITGMHSPIDLVGGIAIGTAIAVPILFLASRWGRWALNPISGWTVRHEALAAALLFLVLYEIARLLENIRDLAHVLKLRSLLAAVAACLLSGCGLDQHGAVLLLESGWHADIIATEQNGISSPDGLRWVGEGVLVADEGGSAVRLWRPGRGFTTIADSRSGMESPEDVVRGSQGNVYFTDDKAGGVWRTDKAGRTVRLASAEDGLGATEGIALAPSGRILVGDGEHHRVVSVSDSGEVRTFLSPAAGIVKPESMAFAPDGSLFIADNEANVLYLLTPHRRLHRPIASRESFSPESLYHSRDALFITDSDNGKLYRYTLLDGLTPIAVFGGELRNIQGIAGDPAGNLYVTIQSNLRGGRGYLIRLSRRL